MQVKSFNLRLVLSAILFVRAQSRSCQSFSITLFCTQLHFFALNYTFCTQLHFFALNLGLTDMLLTNQNAEIVACMLVPIELQFIILKLHLRKHFAHRKINNS